jgi:16S rRNA (adenine1518-N6/adenine1519-N6)-dimethyltransferase
VLHILKRDRSLTVEELPSIREVINHFGLAARKSLGQNFILDLNITRKIARTAGDLTGATIIEVGPGPGALTRALLLEGASKIIAIEKDERCFKALEPLVQAANGRLDVINADALNVDYQKIAPGPKKIVSNLPYNISTLLLLRWLDQPEDVVSLTLMFQKEVAERLIAKPDTTAYGRLSVLTQFRCEAQIAFFLSPQVFVPAPAVQSAVVHFDFCKASLYECGWKELKAVTRFAFAQRRKMLRSTLKPAFRDVALALGILGIDPALRAEVLTLEQFAMLAKVFERERAL